MTLAEWTAEGERRFGSSQMKWRFECPGCGHEQAVEDFRPYKEQGATAESARFNCIGRYSGAKRWAFGEPGGGPCDYTSGGLFDIRPWTVKFPDGAEVKTFAFANSPGSRSAPLLTNPDHRALAQRVIDKPAPENK